MKRKNTENYHGVEGWMKSRGDWRSAEEEALGTGSWSDLRKSDAVTFLQLLGLHHGRPFTSLETAPVVRVDLTSLHW
jgi:hypothetical protein